MQILELFGGVGFIWLSQWTLLDRTLILYLILYKKSNRIPEWANSGCNQEGED